MQDAKRNTAAVQEAQPMNFARLDIGTRVRLLIGDEGDIKKLGINKPFDGYYMAPPVPPGSEGRIVWANDDGKKTSYMVSFKDAGAGGVNLAIDSTNIGNASRFQLLPPASEDASPPWPAHPVGTQVFEAEFQKDDPDAMGFIRSICHGETEKDRQYPYSVCFPSRGYVTLMDDAMLADDARRQITGRLDDEALRMAEEQYEANNDDEALRMAREIEANKANVASLAGGNTNSPSKAALPAGTQILSIHGETAWVDGEGEIETGPNAVGIVAQVHPEQEHCYSVWFDNGVSVFMSDAEIAETKNYQLAGQLSEEELQAYLAKWAEAEEADDESPLMH
jgi:hypothetical protein